MAIVVQIKADQAPVLIARSSLLPVRLGTDQALLQIDVFLRNDADGDISVPVGELVKLTSEYPIVSFSVALEELDGQQIKPSGKKLDIIVLRPGEMTRLASVRMTVRKGDLLERKVSYAVPEELSKFYAIWTGRIESVSKMTVARAE